MQNAEGLVCRRPIRGLADIFESRGLRLNEVFGAEGKPWKADAAEPEIKTNLSQFPSKLQM